MKLPRPEPGEKNPKLVLEFYNMRRRDVRAAAPNEAHVGLARLEKFFEIQIITQNIDDLHERAGSTKVLHLHGEIFKMRSEKDDSLISTIVDDIQIGDMASDGMQFRPHIVWFEEPVPLIVDAGRLVNKADFFAIIGTSLAVYPAAGLIDFAPASIPKFIIDKSIPFTRGIKNLSHIQNRQRWVFLNWKSCYKNIFRSIYDRPYRFRIRYQMDFGISSNFVRLLNS